MDKAIDNTVILRGSRPRAVVQATIAFGMAIGMSAFCWKFLGHCVALRHNGQPLMATVWFVTLGGCATVVLAMGGVQAIRRANDPNLLALSAKGIRFKSLGLIRETAWTNTGAVESRFVGRGGEQLSIALAGLPLILDYDDFGLSPNVLSGIVEAARTGRPMTPAEWIAANPSADGSISGPLGLIALCSMAAIGVSLFYMR